MIDPIAQFRALLLAQPGVMALCGDRIFGESLPMGFDQTADAPQSISIEMQPGPLPAQSPMGTVSFTLYCWGESSARAMAVSLSVIESLHVKQRLNAAGTNWNMVLCSWGKNGILDISIPWIYQSLGVEAHVALL
jgi:hypothetical protein